MRRLGFLLLSLAGISGCRVPSEVIPSGPTMAQNYRVVVAIVVDQLAGWVMAERARELPANGGFARLAREGLYAGDMQFQHAVTETAPGHASLYTGRVPRDNGIYSNEVLRPGDQETVSILRDRATRLVAVDGAAIEGEGSSLANLPAGVPTVADLWQVGHPERRVFSFSLKDRGALFGGGRHPDLVLWLDTKSARMVSSTAFSQHTPPAWAASVGGGEAVAKLLQTPWTLQGNEQAWVAAHAYGDDDHAGESNNILGKSFPHAIPSAAALRATPAGDDLVFDLARSAIQEASGSNGPVLLALSLSANDYIGHLFGPQSWEAWIELLRLDQALARFFTFLDKSAGADAYAVILTADHGINPLPELAASERPWCARTDSWQRPCVSTRRVRGMAKSGSVTPGHTVREVLDGALAGEFGRSGPWIAGVAGPFVYLTESASLSQERARLVSTVQTALAKEFGARRVLDLRQFAHVCSPYTTDDSPDGLLCRSFPVDIAADFFVELAPDDFFDPELDPGFGTNHGSPRRFDRSVPLYLRAPGRVSAGKSIDEPLRFDAFTRTLASLLNLPRDALAPAGRDLCQH